ncbi:MAG: outer membrane beta-barrel protein [Hyphomicrobiaceae bacterium]|nr:outer membrane beta-barrel protein [Hyphomicrobiaceae bacterium]
MRVSFGSGDVVAPGISTVLGGALKRVASYSVLAVAAVAVGGTGAWAECRRSQNPPTGIVDLAPMASGTTVSSIISTISTVNTSSLAQSSAFVGSPPNPQPDQQGGGQWSRVIAGTTEAHNNTTLSGNGSGIIPGVGAVDFTGSGDCRSTTQHDFVGTQAGMDIGRFNFANGGNISWGMTAGYFDITSKDKTANVGTFSGDTQAPFAGLYLSLNSGNFAFDAQVRGDYLSMELSDVDHGMFKHPLTARGLAFQFNASYRFSLANNWFIEPSIGGVSSRTEVDRLEVPGGINVPAALTPSVSMPGVVEIDDINSLQGRASLRAGTTIVNSGIAWQPFATASIFHEFAGSVRTDTTNATGFGGFPGVVGNINTTSFTSREGTVGHVGLGLAGVLLNTGWLGYVRGDYRFGENIESLSVNAGIRYQFSPNNQPMGLKDGGGDRPDESYNWTGIYVGYSSGANWGEQHWVFDGVGSTTSPKFQGAMVGGQVGYNYQIGRAVLGIEADYSWSNAEGGSRCPNSVFFSCIAEVNSIGFLTGRLGYAHQRALYYVKGGLAFGEVESRGKFNLDGAGLVLANPVLSDTETQTGWAFGAGMEYALTDKWSVRGEWLHYDLGSESFLVQAPNVTTRNDTSGNVARIGVNYHFGHREEHHDSIK